MRSLSVLLSILLLSAALVRAEDAPKPADKPAVDPATGGGVGNIQVTTTTGANVQVITTPGANVHMANPGGGGAVLNMGMGGNGRGMNPANSRQWIASMISSAGIDLGEPNFRMPLMQTLPLGTDKQLVNIIPVGGVMGFTQFGQGIGMETVFKLTDEQTKSLTALRDEYAAEKKKIDDELETQQKAVADKARQLRLTFEQRATDVLAGPDKEAKLKLDATAREAFEKAAALLAELSAPKDPKVKEEAPQFNFMEVREKARSIVEEIQTKMCDVLSGDAKTKLSEIFKQQAAMFQGFQGQGRRGGPGGDHRRGGPRAPEGGAVKPPAPPPPPTENKEF
jgi:hypothetical protein